MSFISEWTVPNEPNCCCDFSCNIIARSLCSDTGVVPCGYLEFTCPDSDPPINRSCPRKYYKRYTQTHVLSGISDQGRKDCANFYSITDTKEATLTEIWEYVINEETGICSLGLISAIGISRRTIESVYADPVNNSSFWCDAIYNQEAGYWEYTNSDGNSGIGNCFEFPNPNTLILCSNTEKVFEDIINYHLLVPDGDCLYFENNDQTNTLTFALSDEVTLGDTLSSIVCSEEICTSNDEPPAVNGCRYCCTDRGEGQSGLTYDYPFTPEGCIIAKSRSIAWETTLCQNNAPRTGQSSFLSIWFTELIIGQTYKATITYKRCSFVEDEEGVPILPTCSVYGSCEEAPEFYETITDEVTFVAENWAEVLGNCSNCAVLYKICELEDAANTWNIAHPDDPPRSVSCTSGGFNIPIAHGKYTWFYSCESIAV
jgi:hypothetical protein